MKRIGPSSRRHFYLALQHAGRAEQSIVPGQRVDETQKELARAQIELIRGLAFSFLQPEDDEEDTQ